MIEYVQVVAIELIEVPGISIRPGEFLEVDRAAYQDSDQVLSARLGGVEFSVCYSDVEAEK